MPKPSAEATLFASVVRRQALVESIGLLRLSQPPSSSRLLVGRTRRTPATRIAAYGWRWEGLIRWPGDDPRACEARRNHRTAPRRPNPIARASGELSAGLRSATPATGSDNSGRSAKRRRRSIGDV